MTLWVSISCGRRVVAVIIPVKTSSLPIRLVVIVMESKADQQLFKMQVTIYGPITL